MVEKQKWGGLRVVTLHIALNAKAFEINRH